MTNKMVDFSREDIFSLSSLSYLENYSDKTLDIEWLTSMLEPILRRKFRNPLKQTIDPFSNRITFACPYCGDSEDDPNKRRGNIFFDSLGYHCYNCGYHTSAHNLIKVFSENVTPEELMFLRNFKGVSNSYKNQYTDILNTKLITKYAIPKKDLLESFKFGKIEGTTGGTYLIKRMQTDFTKFAFDARSNAIVIFNQDENENVLGFTKRLLGKDITNRYLSYKLRKKNKKMKIVPEDSLEYLDRISMIFNLMAVNFGQTLTVFEGPFDAFLFENSVATAGLSKELPLDSESIRYWFDSDIPGKNKSKELLLEGKQIFLWDKYFKDCNIPNYKHIKDLNDLLLYAKKNKVKLKAFDEYFSESALDLFFL